MSNLFDTILTVILGGLAYPDKLSTSDSIQFISSITPFLRVGEYDAMAVAQGLDISGRKGVKAARKVKSGPKLAAMNTIENEKEGGLPAVSTAWDIPVISLPNGCNSLPIDLIPLLDRFPTVYLWLDNDKSGREQSSVLCLTKTPSLLRRRCYPFHLVQCRAVRYLTLPYYVAPVYHTRTLTSY
jgi:hypothetical protein